MKKKIWIAVLVSAVLLGITGNSFGWGFWGHKKINHIAVFTLPKGMLAFYKSNIYFVTEHAPDPDKRRFTDKAEAPRHFIDIDHYGKYPFDSFPHLWKDAVAKYSEDTIKEYGTVPWHIQTVYYRLVEAFKARDSAKILQLSADLGHYVGDAFVPLHATENYNGQMSGQVGIHALWESRIPELLGDKYNFFVGKAEYIDNVLDFAWKAVLESSAASDTVLQVEKALNMRFPEDQKYSYKEKKGTAVRDYSDAYVQAYSDTLNGMVERRMRQAIKGVGSMWMSAWIDAGQPDLKGLVNKNQTKEQKKATDEEAGQYRKGKWLGRPEE